MTMGQTQTTFDLLLKEARDLDISVVTGRLWPPRAGSMWIDDRSLDEILLPHATHDAVAMAIIPGGPGWEHVRVGAGILDDERLARMVRLATEAGGHVYQGRLALLTPRDWLEGHGGQPAGDDRSIYDAAKDAGWPSAFDDDPVLFLDDRPVYHLLARENTGRNVILLIGTIEKSREAGGPA